MLMLTSANGTNLISWRNKMKMFRVRLFLSESRWNDIELPGYTCWDAENLGRGMSPIGRAQFLGEAY
jgi:hypothetical protein